MTNPVEASEHENPWRFEGKELSTLPEGLLGFVYLITSKVDGKKYVGKKLFLSSKTKTVKKKKKKIKVESDWKDYYGSSIELLADIEKHGKENFVREVLHMCKSKGECNYWEAYEQFARNVLFDESYYNGHIWVRVHRSHVNKMEGRNGKERIEKDEESYEKRLHGRSSQEDEKPADSDRKKEKGRTRRAQPK